MNHKKGQLVRHPTFGLGKVLMVNGERVTVFFKDVANDPQRTISTSTVPLEVPANQSDPWLDNLDLAIMAPGAKGHYITHQGAIDRFHSLFPLGFKDPKYIGDGKTGERRYKLDAHDLWDSTLNRDEFGRLLAAGQHGEIAERALRVEGTTNLLASFEKMALREALKDAEGAKSFAIGLFDLIYGDDLFEPRFCRFTGVLTALPQRKTGTDKWTTQTIFPFLALPQEHLFLKPGVTQEAARRRAFSLNYQPHPNWLTYSCLLQFGQLLKQDLAELKPCDMIDVQSFIWVTGENSYKGG